MPSFLQQSPIGYWDVYTTEDGLLASMDFIGELSADSADRVPESRQEKQIHCMLTRYFQGEAVDFHRIQVLYPAEPSTARLSVASVMRKLAEIPQGETRSYQWLAEQLGNARAARAIGGLLKRNPVPVIVPCHRIISKSGGLGGYMGNSPDGSRIKRFLLALEGSL